VVEDLRGNGSRWTLHMRWAKGFKLLRNTEFRAFWFSQTLSSAGDSLVQLTLPFAVLRIHHSALVLGLVITAYGAARVVALPLGGVIGDTYSRRTLLLVTESVKAVVYVFVVLAFLTGVVSVTFLVAATVVYGLAYGLGMPAATGALPQLVGTEQLHRGNAFISLCRNVAQVVGFVTCGSLILAFSPVAAYLVAVLCFVADAAALVRLRVGGSPRRTGHSFVRDLVASWSIVRARRWYWANLMTHGLWNVSYAVYFVVGPIVATQYLGGVAGWSALSVAVAIGGVCGSLVAIAIAPRRPLLSGNLAMATAVLGFVGFGVHASLPTLWVLTVVAFAGPAVLNVAWAATVQAQVPAASLSRLSSYDWAVSLCTVPIGSGLAGWSVEVFGVRTTAIWAAACSLVPAVVAVLDPQMRALRTQSSRPVDLEPAMRSDSAR
jgi:MFS family permease